MEWTYNSNAFHPYAGAVYEYEADSGSSHKVYGEEIRRASLTGSTGIGKVGLRFGGGEHRLSLDIGVEGHAGERRGVVGKALLGYAF